MIGLVLATEKEALPLIERLQAERIADEPLPVHRFTADGEGPAGVLVIGGVGRGKAAEAAEHLIADRGATTIINVGVCGALADDLEPGELFAVKQVCDGDEVLAEGPATRCPCETEVWPDLPAKRLATLTKPVFEQDRRTRLSQCSDLVDMEGVAVAEACARHRVRCYLIKGVTDMAGPTGKADIKENLDWVSTRLAETVVHGLARLPLVSANPVKDLHRFTRVEHTLFSLPLLFAGAWLGAGGVFPPWRMLGLIALAGVGARVFGMSMNRIFDRDLDALNKRTAGRELPSGRMSLTRAYSVAGAGLALYLLACAGLGRICLYLSPVPIVPLTVYSLLKRFTNLCHFGIGLCLALAPLGAFVAASGGLSFGPEIALLGLFAFCWISGFDIIYALQDIESDRETGVHSLPASLGSSKAQVVAAGAHVAAAAAIVALWWMGGQSWVAGLATVVAMGAMTMGYVPRIPLPVRFFPMSAIASVAASIVPILGAYS